MKKNSWRLIFTVYALVAFVSLLFTLYLQEHPEDHLTFDLNFFILFTSMIAFVTGWLACRWQNDKAIERWRLATEYVIKHEKAPEQLMRAARSLTSKGKSEFTAFELARESQDIRHDRFMLGYGTQFNALEKLKKSGVLRVKVYSPDHSCPYPKYRYSLFER